MFIWHESCLRLMFLNFIVKVVGSNLSRRTDYPQSLCSEFHQAFTKSLRPLSYASVRCVIHSSLRHLSFCELKTFIPEQATKVQRGSICIALLFLLTWALGGGGGFFNARLRLLYPPRNRPVVWAPEPVLTGAVIPSSLGFDPRTVQPVGSRCTD